MCDEGEGRRRGEEKDWGRRMKGGDEGQRMKGGELRQTGRVEEGKRKKENKKGFVFNVPSQHSQHQGGPSWPDAPLLALGSLMQRT